MHPEVHEPGQGLDGPGGAPVAWRAVFEDGSERRYGEGLPRFTLRVPTVDALEHLLSADAYSAAVAFVRRDFDVEGDLAAASHWRGWEPRSRLRKWLYSLIARCATAMESVQYGRAGAARAIRFHYDRSNEFYRLFLDPRLVYSCGYFRSPDISLEAAQEAKLDHVCRKLALEPGDRFLDVGCGWGSLIEHAAAEYGADAVGCTLSHAQFSYASGRLEGLARVLECDYRALAGHYDKIASLGMFEHVGRWRAPGYFRHIASLLEPHGMYLHHSIARPQGVRDDAASLFLRRQIFPGGQLIHLYEMVRAAEDAGFEVLDVENLRPHYALTCRLWQQRLAANREAALRVVSEPVFRAWLIWLAASSVSFEEGVSSVYQILFAHRGAPRRLTREHVYLPAARPRGASARPAHDG